MSIALSRLLWAGRCRTIAVSRCESVAVGWSLWVGRCRLVAVGGFNSSRSVAMGQSLWRLILPMKALWNFRCVNWSLWGNMNIHFKT